MKEFNYQNTPFIFGMNTVRESLNHHKLKQLFIKKNLKNNKIEDIIKQAKQNKIQFYFQDESFFDPIRNSNHQGIIGVLKESVQIIEGLEKLKEHLIDHPHHQLLMLDKIKDPHNLGAISRSAYFFGVDLIIMEKKDSSPINSTVHKISSGSSLLTKYCIVNSLKLTLNHLRSIDTSIYISSSHSSKSAPLSKTVFKTPLCLVMGSEEKGIRPSLIHSNDHHLHINGIRTFNSLNVSTATAVILNSIKDKLLH